MDFEGAAHAFRLIENHTFGALLTDAAKHWMIDEDDYELHDEEGSTWPSGGTELLLTLTSPYHSANMFN